MPQVILNNKTPAEIHLMADRAREVLRARHKAMAREHNDRIARLTELMRKISTSDDEGHALAGTSSMSLAPELERLILNPTSGL